MPAKYLWDANSLIDCCKYYLALDEARQERLYSFLESKFAPRDGSFAIVERVWEELDVEAKRGRVVVPSTFEFLRRRSILPNSEHLSPDDHEEIDGRFFVSSEKHSEEERREWKREYLKTGDPYLVLAARRLQYGLHGLQRVDCVVVSEESERSDGKEFKKIPVLCRELGVRCMKFRECLRRCGFALD